MTNQPSTAATLTAYFIELRDGGFAYDEAAMLARDAARLLVERTGLTVRDDDAEADAGAWVEVDCLNDCAPDARIRSEWRKGDLLIHYYVHRDDLPPTDPDAELVEKMARALYQDDGGRGWDAQSETVYAMYRRNARAALAVVREHEATR